VRQQPYIKYSKFSSR